MPSSSSTATSEAGTPRDAKVGWRTAEFSAGMAVKKNRLQDSGWSHWLRWSRWPSIRSRWLWRHVRGNRFAHRATYCCVSLPSPG